MADDITTLRLSEIDEPVDPAGWRSTIRLPIVRALAVVAVLAIGSALLLLRGSSASAPTPVASFSAAPIIAARSSAPTLVVVDVSGRVRRAGLVHLPSGSRVADAVAAAGGVRPGTSLDSLNLARVLVDGEQIVVGQPAGVASVAGAASSRGAATTQVAVNTASPTELDSLPGIGPVLAQRIVTWRTQHGPFASIDALSDVPGIGPSLLAKLAGLVRV